MSMQCMEGYLISKITDGETRNIACPGYKSCICVIVFPVPCNRSRDRGIEGSRDVLTHALQVKHCVSKDMYEKYDRFLLASALNSDPSCRWCPRPGCGCAMLGQSDQPMLTCPNEKCMAHVCCAISKCDVSRNDHERLFLHVYRQT